jgi:dolichyl-phosphate beta-glucosyltransferase
MIHFSLVIPAYNESERLPPYLNQIRDYFEKTNFGCYEVIVVDDGSRDGLSEVVARIAVGWPKLKLVRSPTNQGKGAAVRSGVRLAQGEVILFTDADGATPIEEESLLRACIESGSDLAIGSRFPIDRQMKVQRSWHRRTIGALFSLIVRALFRIPFRDPQCGFKMFHAATARRLFESCAEDGYLFDLYILALAERLGYHTAEVVMRWHEVPGSKIRLARDAWRMFTGLWRIKRKLRADDRDLSAEPRPLRTSTSGGAG